MPWEYPFFIIYILNLNVAYRAWMRNGSWKDLGCFLLIMSMAISNNMWIQWSMLHTINIFNNHIGTQVKFQYSLGSLYQFQLDMASQPALQSLGAIFQNTNIIIYEVSRTILKTAPWWMTMLFWKLLPIVPDRRTGLYSPCHSETISYTFIFYYLRDVHCKYLLDITSFNHQWQKHDFSLCMGH